MTFHQNIKVEDAKTVRIERTIEREGKKAVKHSLIVPLFRGLLGYILASNMNVTTLVVGRLFCLVLCVVVLFLEERSQLREGVVHHRGEGNRELKGQVFCFHNHFLLHNLIIRVVVGSKKRLVFRLKFCKCANTLG